MSRVVIGVDPGQTTGVFGFVLAGTSGHYLVTNQLAVQIPSAERCWVTELVTAMIERDEGDYSGPEIVLAIEKFVVGNRSARTSGNAGGITRDLIGQLELLGQQYGAKVYVRSAATVKPWATDDRLEAAGLHTASGMRHAKDAARHALYAAVRADLIPDPFSSRGKTV